MSHNNSYADTNINYSYRKGSTTSTKSYSYGTAFKEETTKTKRISCSAVVEDIYKNNAGCYISCSCQSGWTQGSVPSSGEYVWAKDERYTGVNAMSASSVSDVNSLTEGKSTQSTSGNTQVVSLSGGVSTMSSSGGITCYKAACSSGYYLDAPNSTYFTSSSTTGTIGLTCYKATGCKAGYYSGGSDASYHGMTCSKCSYSCPADYYESGSKWDDYKLTSTSANKVCNGDSSQTNSEKCYTRTLKSCSDYNADYYSSIPSGQTCTKVTPRSDLTCYKDCKAEIYWPEEYYVSATICKTGSPSTTCWLDGEGLTGQLQYSQGRQEMNGYKASDFVITQPNGTYIYILWSGSGQGTPAVQIGQLTYNNPEYVLEENCGVCPQRPCVNGNSTGFTCPQGWGGFDQPTATFATQYANFSETMTQVTLKYIPTGATKKVDLKLSGSVRNGGDLLGGACR